ncbi:MAG: hypothetical protein LBT04_09720 [Prevotellaceae bacterium]|jgi:hypothetical protein|nr:hypothetical protein [Prevotellaceae bacterium]
MIKKTKRLVWLPVFFSLAMLVITSCEKNKEVTSITLDKTTLTVTVGEEYTLTAVVLPEDAPDKTAVRADNNNTGATFILSIIAMSISFLSLLCFIIVHIVFRAKDKKTKNSVQKKISEDMLRHLGRNKIIIDKINEKFGKNEFDKYYPSEEHLLKLKIIEEDMQFEKFDIWTKKYEDLHELKLLLRNLNIETDVALEHFKRKDLLKETKKRDIEMLKVNIESLENKILKIFDITEETRQKIKNKVDNGPKYEIGIVEL